MEQLPEHLQQFPMIIPAVKKTGMDLTLIVVAAITAVGGIITAIIANRRK